MNKKKIEKDWWSSLYDSLLADILLEGTDEQEVAHTIPFLESHLEVGPGARLFDQCCGMGRLSVPAAEAGFQVIGVDLIDLYIERAKSRVVDRNLKLHFEAADACSYTVSPQCDGAFNWWTSFGYFESDDENMAMLRCAFNSLKPGARFALDFMNVPGVLHSFKPEVVTKGVSREHGEMVLIRESEIDVEKGMLLKDWTYFLGSGKRVVHRSKVRIYTPVELRFLFNQIGFINIEIFGDLDSSPITIASPRCIVTGEKPI